MNNNNLYIVKFEFFCIVIKIVIKSNYKKYIL